MPRSLVSAQNAPDQAQQTGGSNVGFGNSTTPYRGQVFQPAVSTLQAVGFWLIDAVGGKDMAVFLTDVDQTLQTPVGGVLQQWIIPAASLVRGAFTIYSLSPAYTGLTIGHKYGLYFGPYLSGVWTSQYRGVAMNTGSAVFPNGCKEMTNTSGTWSTENISWNLVTYGPASRTKIV